MDITEFVDKDFHRNQKFVYDLYAVINHMNHIKIWKLLLLYKLNREKKWFKFNDIEVTELGRLIVYFILKSNNINDIRIYYSNFLYYFYSIINFIFKMF